MILVGVSLFQSDINSQQDVLMCILRICGWVRPHHLQHCIAGGDLLLGEDNAIGPLLLFRENLACFNCAVVVRPISYPLQSQRAAVSPIACT